MHFYNHVINKDTENESYYGYCERCSKLCGSSEIPNAEKDWFEEDTFTAIPVCDHCGITGDDVAEDAAADKALAALDAFLSKTDDEDAYA